MAPETAQPFVRPFAGLSPSDSTPLMGQQVTPNWVVLDDVEFAAVDTRPPSPWEQVMSLIGGAMALGMVGAMAPAIAKGMALRQAQGVARKG